MKALRIIVAVICFTIATTLLLLTRKAQMCDDYTATQFLASCILDYGFMFIVWLIADEKIINKFKH